MPGSVLSLHAPGDRPVADEELSIVAEFLARVDHLPVENSAVEVNRVIHC